MNEIIDANTGEIISGDWYTLLIDDCKAIITETGFISRWALVEGYHTLGQRILDENDSFKREKIYGKEIVQCIAQSLGKSKRTLFQAIQFARTYPDLNDVPFGKDLSWYRVCNELLPGVEKDNVFLDDRLAVPYGENIFYLTTKFQDRPSDFVIIKDGDTYPTLKRRSWFYHEDGSEFSLREYARVQEFPDGFAFIGTYEKIKDQIGNAVPPTMARHIGNDLIGKTFGDLFAGAGGLSCGLGQLGKTSVWAIESNIAYARTYKVNHPNTRIETKDIRILSPKDFQEVDIIVGGPPCQGFSLSGKHFSDDPRNELYKEFVRFVKELLPGEFLLENVPQIQEVKDDIISEFENIGYKVRTELIKGEDIGMRQKRHRFFFIGRKVNNG